MRGPKRVKPLSALLTSPHKNVVNALDGITDWDLEVYLRSLTTVEVPVTSPWTDASDAFDGLRDDRRLVAPIQACRWLMATDMWEAFQSCGGLQKIDGWQGKLVHACTQVKDDGAAHERLSKTNVATAFVDKVEAALVLFCKEFPIAVKKVWKQMDPHAGQRKRHGVHSPALLWTTKPSLQQAGHGDVRPEQYQFLVMLSANGSPTLQYGGPVCTTRNIAKAWGWKGALPELSTPLRELLRLYAPIVTMRRKPLERWMKSIGNVSALARGAIAGLSGGVVHAGPSSPGCRVVGFAVAGGYRRRVRPYQAADDQHTPWSLGWQLLQWMRGQAGAESMGLATATKFMMAIRDDYKKDYTPAMSWPQGHEAATFFGS